MNTIEELVSKGINEYNAIQMLESYSAKIGTINGMYEITDIVYDCDSKARDITLRCTECGKIIHRKMASGKNKWKELIKKCSCRKEKERAEKEAALENYKKQKRMEIQSRVGRTYGDCTIISLEDIDAVPKYTMRCNICGDERVISANNFTLVNFNCGHVCHDKVSYDESYIGKKYNYLTVIGIGRTESNRHAFLCRCDCGTEKLISPFHVVNGITKSCGCQSVRLMSEALYKEDAVSRQRLHGVWTGMKQRCYNPNSDSYRHYGARGISMCDEWKNSYDAFKEWAYENGYDENAERGECTIDRIDVNGNYEPSNCRWVDMVVQASNKRPRQRNVNSQGKQSLFSNPAMEIDGVSMKFTDWCDLYGIGPMTVKYRIENMGMTLKEALTAKKATQGRPRKGA